MNQGERAIECLECLRADIEGKNKRTIMSLEEFLELVRSDPQRVLRSIFQLFYDVVQSYVVEKEDEYPGDPESIGFVEFDCSKIFAADKDNPFFPDRLLANRFVRQVRGLKRGSQQKRIYIYEGPPGCGKSTFLDNLIQTFEEYTNTKEGQSFEIFWDITDDTDRKSNKVEVPCPSHDHPILIIPRKYRKNALGGLLAGEKAEIRDKFFNEKEYEWLFKGEVCTICRSLFHALSHKFGSLDKVFSMIKVRPYQFSRRVGEGISVFNPGDKPLKEMHFSDKQIQDKLDQLFGVGRIRYIFSPLARTNNGIYAIMDIKSHNRDRLLELHNVISEGVHRVGSIEERISSLYFALMNPEDKEVLKEAKSFEGRIDFGKISYVMEVPVEIKIYRSVFGEDIDSRFLPRVLENFARVIISSRMNQECEPLKDWLQNTRLQYYHGKHYCDEGGILLRMEIYGGIIPSWLSEEDKKKFTAPIRRSLIAEAVNEGVKGFSGRDSLRLFADFLNLYGQKPNEPKFNLITMANVIDFFEHRVDKRTNEDNISPDFIKSLVDWYDFTVLCEVKEALYFYNKEQIQEDILNYLCAVNYDPDGRKVKCEYTHKDIEVTIELFKMVGGYITGEQMNDRVALRHAQSIQKKYIEMIAREPGKKITETELYQDLFSSYVRNLKEKVLDPFIDNESFRQAVKSFGSKEFNTFDMRTKEHIAYMIKNLIDKFGYTEQGAKEVCLYVLDQNLVRKFYKS